ncbi:MASE3 domain-containing protein [Desulforudis sp. 1031]|uniref:MASE3 domain-containing protein n=1 Tax=unclassified Candidatus Desulforudis TaxID=2635950 RepID=UPI003CE4DDBF
MNLRANAHPFSYERTNSLFKISLSSALIFVLLALVNWALSQALAPVVFPKNTVQWHTLVEVLCLSVAAFVFFISWITYEHRVPCTNSLGFGFLLVALLDLMHVLSFPVHNYFNSDPDLYAWFRILARSAGAAVFLGIALGLRSGISRTRLFLLTLGAFSLVSFVLLSFSDLPPLFVDGRGSTLLNLIWEYVICVAYVIALILIIGHSEQWEGKGLQAIILAILCALAAELCFTVSTTVTSLWNILGHNFKLGSYLFVLWGIIARSVIYPYSALRSSEERFYKAFRASPSLMTIASLEDGRLIEVNESWTRATGYGWGEAVGRTPAELNIEMAPWDHVKIKNMLRKEGAIRNLEVHLRTKSSEVRTVLLSAEILELEDNRCVLTVASDITDRRRMEKEMARLDSLNLVGEMAGGIAHGIRNPMTSVRGFLQMFGEKNEFSRYRKHIDLMISELDRANSIITEFLSLAKNRVVKISKQNLNSTVNALLPLIEADGVTNDKYVVTYLGDIPDLDYDEKEIRQMILNLAKNGLEAMAPGGLLTIKTFVDGKDVVLAVQDEGTGIEPELLEKLGTPFLTTKEHGTGLGLAVCYSIAARHNATISVDTGPTGTTFFVRFKPSKKAYGHDLPVADMPNGGRKAL